MSGVYPSTNKLSPRDAVNRVKKTLTMEDALVVVARLQDRFHTAFGEPQSFEILEAAAKERIEARFVELVDSVDNITGLITFEAAK